jgi:hypothetical protein
MAEEPESPSAHPGPSSPSSIVARWSIAGVLVLFLVGAVAGARRCATPPVPAIPPISSSVTIVRPTPNLLLAVRDLARLESTSFHMERVIDLSEKQSQLFGLFESEDAILLVAVADVSAGVDLNKIDASDIVVDSEKKTARITLPKAEIFHTELDNEKTYVHTRRTGVLAKRQENLETRARQEAERNLVEAAKEAGILKKASDNARHVVGGLVRSLGYEQVEVTVKE